MTNTKPPAVEIDAITKSYGETTAIRGVSMDVRDGEFVVTPDQPLHGVAPGQTAVVYDGTRVLGQCTIDRTVSAVPAPV